MILTRIYKGVWRDDKMQFFNFFIISTYTLQQTTQFYFQDMIIRGSDSSNI